MTMKFSFLQAQHACQIILSAYGFRHSYIAITNLQKYEDATKKLAKWSQEVQNQLHKTRMTQGTGMLTILMSLVVASILMLGKRFFPTWAILSASPVMLVIVIAARAYIKKFWAPTEDSRGKEVGLKVPLLPNMDDYNLAVQKTEDLLKVLEYLEYSWLLTSLVTFTIGNE